MKDREEAVRLAREHVAGHDADMSELPDCARCKSAIDSGFEPCAFCSDCMYQVADVLAEQVLALDERCKAAEALADAACKLYDRAEKCHDLAYLGCPMSHSDIESALYDEVEAYRAATARSTLPNPSGEG